MDNCERFELDMIDYLDGTLDAERVSALSAHLGGCPACSHRLALMRTLMEETSALSVEIPDGLHEKIMSRVGRGQKGGKLLRFASRRVVATAAAVALLVCAASIYGVTRLQNQKSMDSAAWELTAQNYKYKSTAALDENTSEQAADAGDDAAAGDMDGSSYDGTPGLENDVAMDAAAPAECDAGDVGELDAADQSESLKMPRELFSKLAEDTRYAAVVVMDAEEIPAALQDYTLMPTGEETDANRDEVLYIIVPADKLNEVVEECRAEDIKLTQYDAENPAPDIEFIDSSAENTLFILQVTE